MLVNITPEDIEHQRGITFLMTQGKWWPRGRHHTRGRNAHVYGDITSCFCEMLNYQILKDREQTIKGFSESPACLCPIPHTPSSYSWTHLWQLPLFHPHALSGKKTNTAHVDPFWVRDMTRLTGRDLHLTQTTMLAMGILLTVSGKGHHSEPPNSSPASVPDSILGGWEGYTEQPAAWRRAEAGETQL